MKDETKLGASLFLFFFFSFELFFKLKFLMLDGRLDDPTENIERIGSMDEIGWRGFD